VKILTLVAEMDHNWHTENILLGKGGSKPGVTVFNTESNQAERLHSLPDGQSVYAISLSPDGNTLAAGTKNGFLYKITYEPDAKDNPENAIQKIIHGYPILSTCFLDTTNLAVSDTAGRCLTWDLAGEVEPQKLYGGKDMVCSLFQLANNNLAGISSAERLLIWDWPQQKIIQELEIPKLPTWSALVKPVYWRKEDSWVWPGQNGVIVFYRVHHNDIHTICAHEGDIYAITVCDDQLWTIGKNDGDLKCWETGRDEPVKSIDAPLGIISVAVWGNKVLLVNEKGMAGIYEFSNSQFGFIQMLSGCGYRIAIGPDLEKSNAALKQKENQLVKQIIAQIESKIVSHQWSDLNDLHEQLIRMGRKDASLVLRGKEARAKDDIVGELISYNNLTGSISIKESGTKDHWKRYAQLLEDAWLPNNAYEVYQQLSKMYPADQSCAVNAERLEEVVKVLEGNEYIIDTDTPLALLIKSAMVVNQPFVGRYRIKTLDEVNTWGTIILPDSLVGKYERIRQNAHKVPLPRGQQKELWWLLTGKKEQVCVVIFASSAPDFLSSLEFGIKFLNGGLQPVLRPVILFNAGEKSANISVKEHNKCVLNKLREIENKDLSNKWLQVVHEKVSEVIGRLINRGLWERNRKDGINYENSNKISITK